MWGLPEVPVYSVGHTGGIDASTFKALVGKGPSDSMVRAAIRSICQHTAWFHRRGDLTPLPVLPMVAPVPGPPRCTSIQWMGKRLDSLLVALPPMDTFPTGARGWPYVPLLQSLASSGVCSSSFSLVREGRRRIVRLPGPDDVVYTALDSPGSHIAPHEGTRIILVEVPLPPPAMYDPRALGETLWAVETGHQGGRRVLTAVAVAPVTEPLAVRALSLRRHFLSLAKLLGEVFTRRFSHMAVVGE